MFPLWTPSNRFKVNFFKSHRMDIINSFSDLERRIAEEEARNQSIDFQLTEVERQRGVLAVECAHLKDQLRQNEIEQRTQTDKVNLLSNLIILKASSSRKAYGRPLIIKR